MFSTDNIRLQRDQRVRMKANACWMARCVCLRSIYDACIHHIRMHSIRKDHSRSFRSSLDMHNMFLSSALNIQYGYCFSKLSPLLQLLPFLIWLSYSPLLSISIEQTHSFSFGLFFSLFQLSSAGFHSLSLVRTHVAICLCFYKKKNVNMSLFFHVPSCFPSISHLFFSFGYAISILCYSAMGAVFFYLLAWALWWSSHFYALNCHT